MPQLKPKVNIPPALEILDVAMRKLFGVTAGWRKQTDILKNNYALGVEHYNKGNMSDAILRFKLVTWLDKAHAGAWYYLGSAYAAEDDSANARKALDRAIALKPGWDEAIYMRAVVGGGKVQMPQKMPLSLSKRHFDALATGFNVEQIETYNYQGHTLIAKALLPTLTPGRIDHQLLELGVGTGLCGPQMRGVSSRMVGVDISLPMLEQAKALGVYDELLQRDLQEYLSQTGDGAFDIVLAAGVFSYVGPLEDVFRAVSRVLKTGGRFAFTADILGTGEGARFNPQDGRFAFSEDYLRGLATAHGFNELTLSRAQVYAGQAMWLCVFGK